MARSFRKHPMPNMGSEKQDKKIWHGRMRSAERHNLHNFIYRAIKTVEMPTAYYIKEVDGKRYIMDDDFVDVEVGNDFVTTHFREVSNPWDMAKDGKYNCGSEGLRSSKMNPRHTPRLVIHDVENYWNPASNWRK